MEKKNLFKETFPYAEGVFLKVFMKKWKLEVLYTNQYLYRENDSAKFIYLIKTG